MPKNRTKNSPRPVVEEPYIKDFLDMVAPSVIDFKVDHYLCGNTCRCVWALREYPTSTDEQAILRHLGEMDGVTIRIYTRQVTPSEERRIIHNAANKHRMSRSSTEDLQQTVTAEANLQDVVTLVSSMHRNREPLLHCAVFLELTAPDYDTLKLLQTDVLTELVRSKLNVDRLMLRQQEGFVSVMPAGRNAFGAQFERVLPASSVANLYPFNYSGKTDPHGFYIGKDKYGANILVDFDKRDDDKTSANILILGNSGQGKSYLLKLLLLNFLEAGKSVISLDVEHEQKDMCETVGGCFMDLMGGVYRMEVLITYASTEEQVIEKEMPSVTNSQTSENDAGGTSRVISESSRQENTVYQTGRDGSKTPYVTHTLSAKVEGVTVLAQGGDSSILQKNITEVIEALFDIEPHKIKVAKMADTR